VNLAAHTRPDWGPRQADARLLYPLSEFYAASGLPLPAVSPVQPPEMAEPYRRLLIHERDMTPTLEAAYGQTIGLRVIKYELRGQTFFRHVLLVLEETGTVVEMGAIAIHLERFPEEARQLVLERKKPLGTILRVQRLAHHCRPAAYFQVSADAQMAEALGTGAGARLYGRQNVLWDSSGHELAQVVEILPPSHPFPHEGTNHG
jgi:chorismate-pyruvate lyase